MCLCVSTNAIAAADRFETHGTKLYYSIVYMSSIWTRSYDDWYSNEAEHTYRHSFSGLNLCTSCCARRERAVMIIPCACVCCLLNLWMLGQKYVYNEFLSTKVNGCFWVRKTNNAHDMREECVLCDDWMMGTKIKTLVNISHVCHKNSTRCLNDVSV